MHSNDTLVDSPFMASFMFVLNKLPPGVCWGGGGGGGGATGLLNKGGGSNRLPALVCYWSS